MCHAVRCSRQSVLLLKRHFSRERPKFVTQSYPVRRESKKTRQGGMRNKTRSSSQKMWFADGGERDPVRLFEEWFARRPA